METVGEPGAVEQLDDLTVRVGDEDRGLETGLLEDGAAVRDHCGARGVDVLDTEREMGQTRLENGPFPRRERFRVAEGEQLEHEAVPLEVDRVEADRVGEAQELRRLRAAHIEIQDLHEFEDADVELAARRQVANALADVTEDHHVADLLRSHRSAGLPAATPATRRPTPARTRWRAGSPRWSRAPPPAGR